MARRKHYNSYDDDFKATAISLTEIPGVLVKHPEGASARFIITFREAGLGAADFEIRAM